VPDPVTYTGVLSIGEPTAVRLAQLLGAHRQARGTRKGRRALGPWRQAVLVLRWFLDATRIAQLAIDNGISSSTAYRYLHEGIDVLAAVAPGAAGRQVGERAAVRTLAVQVDTVAARCETESSAALLAEAAQLHASLTVLLDGGGSENGRQQLHRAITSSAALLSQFG
jgi:hypothetical protein